MNNSIYIFRELKNKPVLKYLPGSEERQGLPEVLESHYSKVIDIPRLLWETPKNHLMQLLSETSTGSKSDLKNEIYAVANEPLFDRIMSNIDLARTS